MTRTAGDGIAADAMRPDGPASRTRAPRWAIALAVLGLLLVLGGYDHAIWQKERLLARGATVRLALAPVDPRALLTGDYMALDYAIARDIVQATGQRRDLTRCGPIGAERDARCDDGAIRARFDGWAVVRLDASGVATLARATIGERPVPGPGEILLRYRQRDGRARLGTDAWYFQEGTGTEYQQARYGEFRVDDDGTMVLVRMLDAKLEALGRQGG